MKNEVNDAGRIQRTAIDCTAGDMLSPQALLSRFTVQATLLEWGQASGILSQLGTFFSTAVMTPPEACS